MELFKHKILLTLLFVVVLNVVVLVLLRQLNVFIHGDLYSYGLIFSYDWISDVWHYNLSCWTFIIGATTLAAFTVVTNYILSDEVEPSRSSVIVGFLLPAIAMFFEGLSIFFLNQIDFVVRNSLYDFGIPANFDWSVAFEPLIWTAYGLMAISLMLLIIPAMRVLGIVKIEIVDED